MYLASVSDSLKVWDVSNFDRDCRLCSSQRSISEYLCLSWNHTNQVVAVGGRENKVHIVQASNGSVLQSFQVTETALTNFKVPTLSFSHNSRYLTIGVESSIQLWDLKKRQVKHVLTGHKSSVVSLQFNSNGDFFGADEEGSIKLWSSKSYEAVNITEDNRGVRPIHSLTKLAISPIAPVVAAGYDDGSLRVWDIANGINTVCQLPLHMSKLTDISCSTKNSRLLATSSLDDHIHLIDTGAPSRYVCSTINVEQRVSAISFHEDGMHCAVGATDGTIIIYDWRNTSEPVSITDAHGPFPVQALSFQSYRPSGTKEAVSEYTVDSVRSNAEKRMPQGNGSQKAVALTRSIEQELAVFERPKSEVPSVATVERSPLRTNHTLQAPTSSMKPKAPHTAASSLHHRMDLLDELPAEQLSSSARYISAKDTKPIDMSIHAVDTGTDDSKSIPSTKVVSVVRSSQNDDIATFENQYKKRMGAYLEVGQDRIHRRDKDFEEEVRQSIDHALPLPHSALPPSEKYSFSVHGKGTDATEEFSALREAVRPVTHKELEESMELLKYDIHQELQEVMREQVRQFTIAKVWLLLLYLFSNHPNL